MIYDYVYNHLGMETKQNGSMYSPAPKQVGLSAMKRKVPFTPEAVVVSIKTL